MAGLQNLPPEVIHHIVTFLDAQPPSEHHLFSEPLLRNLNQSLQPLKALSLTNWKIRRVCMRLLLHHLRVDFVHALNECIALLAKYQVNRARVKSAILCEDPTQQDGINTTQIWGTIADVLRRINPAIITIVFPPVTLSSLLILSDQLSDAWAFQIPLQTLRLEREELSTECANHDPGLHLSYDGRHVFGIRPWTRLSYNEGSSVPAYSTYEYFHLKKPSWIMQSSPSTLENWTSRGYLSHLTCFDYVSVFPYQDMSALWSFCDQLRSLRLLRVQLTPCMEYSATGGTRSSDIESGRADPKDLWMEFEKALTSLGTWLEEDCRLPRLERVELLDYANEALRKTMDRCLQQRFRLWTRCDDFAWTKAVPLVLGT